jgi:hypothetical protein
MTEIKSMACVGLKQGAVSIPRTRCAKCNKVKTYLNPNAKCWECKNKFCFGHIWRGLFKKGMKTSDEARLVCDICKDEHGYREWSPDINTWMLKTCEK